MTALPLDIGGIHFVGVGGMGMSGIAEVMHNLGYEVQGSDIAESANVRRLKALGIPVVIGHAAENLGAAQVIVTSTAVNPDNVEVVAARAAMLPIVRRAEMLAELMRLKWSIAVGGTHGKTTVTSLIAALLEAAQFDPTVINGGIINAYGTNARLGAGKWMVVEADESDGTFVKLPATIAVVTNIDPEHLDFYGNFDAERAAFQAFVENIPFYGFAAMCIDHAEVQAMIARISDRKLVTYGLSPLADVRGINLRGEAGGTVFDVVHTDRVGGRVWTFEGVRLPMPGPHNVQNALAAITVARELGLDETVVRRALREFKGVKRRFTRTGEGAGITVIDDYGHHPVEIAAVLTAARSITEGALIAVVQPHRFTRLRDLLEDFCTCFNEADVVVVAQVYPAGEEPIEGIHRDRLIEGVRAHGHRKVVPLERPEELAAIIAGLARSGDMVVCLGAGSITNWAQTLPAELEAQARSGTAGKRAAGTEGGR